MTVLDTDHLTVIQRQSEPAYSILRDRLRDTADSIGTPIVSVEEQMRGWLTVINRALRAEQDEAATVQLTHLRRRRLQLGTIDLKIAAIALTQKATLLLVTCRISDELLVFRLKIGHKTNSEKRRSIHVL